MSVILLAKLDKQIAGAKDLERVALRCLHATQVIEGALVTFISAMSDTTPRAGSCADIMGVFDAHVGDCACHIRAQMLWELVGHCRLVGYEWMCRAILGLRGAKVEILSLLSSIRQHQNLHRGSISTYGDLFRHVGISTLLSIPEGRDESQSATPGGSLDHTSSSSESVSMPRTPFDPADHPGLISPAPKKDLSQTRDLNSNSLRTALNAHLSKHLHKTTTTSSSTSHPHRNVDIDEWDITDNTMIVRLLTFSRLLSVYTVSLRSDNTSGHTRSRPDPGLAYDQSIKELQALDSVQDSNVLEMLRKARPSKGAFIKEQESLQVYLSHLTANWVKKLTGSVGVSALVKRCEFFHFISSTYH